MAFLILFAFLFLPLVEITLFILVGDILGLGATIGLIVLTMLGGAWLLRHLGFTALRRLRADLARQEYPGVELFNTVCFFTAAVLLILPGFFTDILGFLLFIPGPRNVLRRTLLRYLVSSGVVFVQDDVSFHNGNGGHSSGVFDDDDPGRRHPPGGDHIIEGEFKDLTSQRKRPDTDAPSLTNARDQDRNGEESIEHSDNDEKPPSF
ncbi:MAG: FxsA family protein [Nitrospinaceae bacterium]|jgi:UPF0716 protein FxsA|nr:FxsA family protein [Alphaproteobacteria bacterium]MEE1551321.1 FxsA family protein [Nitrospinaceae bacterium]HJO89486.1 FxsA family protein [Alphaproteobacteria bacterium]|tara:strand:+ start:204 stop:824 length:621 start_codon:yes stop_codon:yes gene_type:complete